MSDVYRTTRRVEWADTDAAGIAHFTSLLRFMEEAEHEMLRSHGLDIHARDQGHAISWPRVSVRCEFASPLKYGDEVNIAVNVVRRGEKSVTYGFDFELDGREVAHGEITAVCCRVAPGEPPKSVAIPDWFAAKLPPPSET